MRLRSNTNVSDTENSFWINPISSLFDFLLRLPRYVLEKKGYFMIHHSEKIFPFSKFVIKNEKKSLMCNQLLLIHITFTYN